SHCPGADRDLHPSPTRRSSDLGEAPHRAGNEQTEGRRDPSKRSMPPRWTWIVFALILLFNILLGQYFFPGADEPTTVPYTLFKEDRKSTRLNSSHVKISYAVFC